MLDVAPTELLLVAAVALLVIGPKDLPKAMRFVGKWVGKARGVARQFRSGLDTMVRESELAEMEKQWAAENERIMREYPQQTLPAPDAAPIAAEVEFGGMEDDPPILVEQPEIRREPELDLGGAPIEPAPNPKSKRPTKPKAKPEGAA